MSKEPCPQYDTACSGGIPARQRDLEDLEPSIKESVASDVSPERKEGAVKCTYCGMVYRYLGAEQADVLGWHDSVSHRGEWKAAAQETTIHRNDGRPFFMRPDGRCDYA